MGTRWNRLGYEHFFLMKSSIFTAEKSHGQVFVMFELCNDIRHNIQSERVIQVWIEYSLPEVHSLFSQVQKLTSLKMQG